MQEIEEAGEVPPRAEDPSAVPDAGTDTDVAHGDGVPGEADEPTATEEVAVSDGEPAEDVAAGVHRIGS